MTNALTLYSNPMSRGRIARWMLEEIGAPYETVYLAYGDAMRTKDYARINPMGKVPALRHGDLVVTECAAICAYLADAFPEAELAPAPGDRAAYYRWLFFAAGPLEAAVTNAALGVAVPDERKGMVGYGSLGDVLDTLERRLAGAPYFAGDRFSAADVYAGAQIVWGLQFGTIERRPAFEDYARRITGRPAFGRAKSLDDAASPPASFGEGKSPGEQER
jgi:glutathione S-transferase